VPLHATGSITDHGSINLNTNGRPAVIKLAKGDLIVQHSNSNRKTTGYDQSTGVMTAVETGTFKVVSGTGSYKGANGHGDFRINLTLKFAPGTSESTAQTSSLTVGPSGNPQSGVVVFHADGPVTP
jgi:hypothetical protein